MGVLDFLRKDIVDRIRNEIGKLRGKSERKKSSKQTQPSPVSSSPFKRTPPSPTSSKESPFKKTPKSTQPVSRHVSSPIKKSQSSKKTTASSTSRGGFSKKVVGYLGSAIKGAKQVGEKLQQMQMQQKIRKTTTSIQPPIKGPLLSPVQQTPAGPVRTELAPPIEEVKKPSWIKKIGPYAQQMKAPLQNYAINWQPVTEGKQYVTIESKKYLGAPKEKYKVPLSQLQQWKGAKKFEVEKKLEKSYKAQTVLEGLRATALLGGTIAGANLMKGKTTESVNPFEIPHQPKIGRKQESVVKILPKSESKGYFYSENLITGEKSAGMYKTGKTTVVVPIPLQIKGRTEYAYGVSKVPTTATVGKTRSGELFVGATYRIYKRGDLEKSFGITITPTGSSYVTGYATPSEFEYTKPNVIKTYRYTGITTSKEQTGPLIYRGVEAQIQVLRQPSEIVRGFYGGSAGRRSIPTLTQQQITQIVQQIQTPSTYQISTPLVGGVALPERKLIGIPTETIKTKAKQLTQSIVITKEKKQTTIPPVTEIVTPRVTGIVEKLKKQTSTLQKRITSTHPRIISSTSTSTSTEVATATLEATSQPMPVPTPPLVSTPVPPPPAPPRVPLMPPLGFPAPGGGGILGGLRGYYKKLTRQFKYTPSFTAKAFKIVGKKPHKRIFTGLELRPIPKEAYVPKIPKINAPKGVAGIVPADMLKKLRKKVMNMRRRRTVRRRRKVRRRSPRRRRRR